MYSEDGCIYHSFLIAKFEHGDKALEYLKANTPITLIELNKLDTRRISITMRTPIESSVDNIETYLCEIVNYARKYKCEYEVQGILKGY